MQLGRYGTEQKEDLLKSRTGSIESSTCSTSSLSKARTIWNIPSTAWMCERKALPSPSPCEAPLIRPAMSVTWRLGWDVSWI